MTSIVHPPVYDGRSALDGWLQRFEVCAKANGWDEDVKGDKLPAFLDGEALVVYLQLPSDRRAFKDIKLALEVAFLPPEGRGEHLMAFEKLMMRDGDSPRTFMFELQRLLALAMPKLEPEAKEQLLLHHFIYGLPDDISLAIRTSPACSTSDAALARALVLTATRKARPCTVAAVTDGASSVANNDAPDIGSRLDQLERELQRLRMGAPDEPANDDAVAAVAPTRPKKQADSGRYAATRAYGHTRREAPRGPRCFACMGFGHLARQCANNAAAQGEGPEPRRAQYQGNARGAAVVRGTAGRF